MDWELVFKLMKEKHIKRAQICEYTGIKPNTWDTMKQRKPQKVDVLLVQKIAECLGVTAERLLQMPEKETEEDLLEKALKKYSPEAREIIEFLLKKLDKKEDKKEKGEG